VRDGVRSRARSPKIRTTGERQRGSPLASRGTRFDPGRSKQNLGTLNTRGGGRGEGDKGGVEKETRDRAREEDARGRTARREEQVR